MVKAIVKIYGNHIIRGTKLFEEVPENIKQEVKDYILSIDPTFFAGNDHSNDHIDDNSEEVNPSNTEVSDSESSDNSESNDADNTPSKDTELDSSAETSTEIDKSEEAVKFETVSDNNETINSEEPTTPNAVEETTDTEQPSDSANSKEVDNETSASDSADEADSNDAEEINPTDNADETAKADKADSSNDSENDSSDSSEVYQDNTADVITATDQYDDSKQEEKPFSFNEAYANAENGGTIKLLNDVNINRAISINKPVVIDLNGHSIVSEKNCLSVTADLTINGEGKIAGGSGGSYTAITAKSGNVILNNGEYTVGADETNEGNSCIYVNGDAIVNINGGKFSTQAAYKDKYYVLNKKNGCAGSIKVTGGQFINYDPANGDDADDGNFLAEGYIVTEDNGVYTVNKSE